MSCSVSIFKFLVIIVNLLVALCGLALIVDGLFLGDRYNEILVPEIIIGGVLFAASSLECFGIFTESIWILLTFALILLSMFMLSIIFGLIVIFVLSLSKLTYIKCTFDVIKLFNDYLKDIDTKGLIQKQLEMVCCGADGPDDFAPPFNSSFPTTCCENGGRLNCRLGDSDVIEMGCLEACEIEIWSTKLLGLIIIAFAFIELAGAICSLCLASSIKNQSNRRYYM